MYQPLPTPKRDRSAYHAALRDLAAMVRVGVADESVPEEWFAPLVRAEIQVRSGG